MMEFIAFARAHGVDIDPGKCYPDEKIKRCGTVDKPKSNNGAFLWNGKQGWVQNWTEGQGPQWFDNPKADNWTVAEKEDWLAKRRANRVKIEDGYAQAAQRAVDLMQRCQPVNHNYLFIKGFKDAMGLVTPDGKLLIPMRSMEDNALQGAQLIWWDEEARHYEKKMLPGMRAKGAIFRMGDKQASETVLVEGYATGLSVHEALRSIGLRCAVVVCFSAMNMELVALSITGRAWVFADNDSHKTSQGEKSAIATGLPYCMSPIAGYDANDVHLKQGLMAVCHLIMQARRA